MSKSYRIKTTPGEDNGYLKVNVDLTQNYDHLEILSLKLSQLDDYQSYCSEYGVIAGRVDINDGFGVPNVKVSIFVPIENADLNDNIISSLYPYQTPFPDEKNVNGIRYNVLPKNKQTLDHTPVGTFPKKREILDDSTILEIYEKYYKYTTTTNKSGDYILFGVPVGDHILHYDCDLSDIGFISSRPYEMMSQGYSNDLFKNRFKFKSSNNLDSLAQIISQNISVVVEPFWCDSLSVGSPLGINRYDIAIPYDVTPTAIFMGSIFSDDEKDSLNKNCKPGREMGRMNEVITGTGNIEAIRRNIDGGIETFSFSDNSIDENGNWSVLVPMNIRKVVTDEFGNLIPSPDGKKGIATEGDYRFRMSMDATGNDKRLRQRAKFLVPNTNNNFNFGSFSQDYLKTATDFTINRQLSTITSGTTYEYDITNQYNYLEEFYSFRWKKVYTVKQYIGRYQKLQFDEARGFVGVKDIVNSVGVNKYPSNRLETNINPLYSIICILLTVFGHIVGLINAIIMIINGLVTTICSVKIPTKISILFCLRILNGFCTDNYKNNDYACGGDDTDCPLASTSQGVPRVCGECNNCRNNSACAKRNEFTIEIGWKCLFSKLLCKKCGQSCGPNQHSCCPNDYGPVDNPDECDDEIFQDARFGVPGKPCCCDCCLKIPLIPLKCADEGKEWKLSTLIPTPFAPLKCNKNFVAPFSCVNCGGVQTPGIKDWVSCVLEPVAVWLRMLKFDFYNDWVGGSLYFPLIKRKYKLKKNKKKSGQLKKDKYCDFDCRERRQLVGGVFYQPTSFQGDPFYYQWRIKIPNFLFSNPTMEVQGCRAKLKGKRVTDWYGTQVDDSESTNLDLAIKEFNFPGKDSNDAGCNIKFSTFADFESTFNSLSINFDIQSHRVSTTHGKPEYIEVEDSNGNRSWKNIGGHSHQRNVCNDTRLLERNEYFKTELDCQELSDAEKEDIAAANQEVIDKPEDPEDETNDEDLGNCPVELSGGTCAYDCNPDCGTNGVAPCKSSPDQESRNLYNNAIIKHGLISWNDDEIYYTPRIMPDVGDKYFNDDEYKGNLLLPTTIMELGSSVYCDIDDVPFIMDQLEPTTFQVSIEDTKYRSNNLGDYEGPDNIVNTPDDGILREFTIFDDKKDASLNLRAYVEFGCTSVICVNTLASVNQSQIGVEMIDKNDIGVEIGNCFVRFDHDADLRGYFCRRFNGFKGDSSFHHTRPGSIQFDNTYNTYPEITLTDGFNLYYQFPSGMGADVVKSEYNDGDAFIPGDACGYTNTDNTLEADYFYGLAPGQTSSFINYPNTDTSYGDNGTIDFGITAHADGIDVIFDAESADNDTLVDDNINGNLDSNGIRFNRSQTPYHLYFGLVPGKTSLQKTVGKFFADKINAITLEGVGASNDSVSENINNSPNLNNPEDNPFTVYKTCLGESLVENIIVGTPPINTGGPGSSGPGSSGPGGTGPFVPGPGTPITPPVTNPITSTNSPNNTPGLITATDTYVLSQPGFQYSMPITTMQGTITIETTDVPFLAVRVYGGDRNIGGFVFDKNDATFATIEILYENSLGVTVPFDNFNPPDNTVNANYVNIWNYRTISHPTLPTLELGTYHYNIQADFQTYSGPDSDPIGLNTTGTVELCVGDCPPNPCCP